MTISRLILSTMLLLVAAAPSLAAEGRSYVGGQVGMFLPIRSSVSGGFGGGTGRLTYDPGVVVAAVGGYQLDNGLRGEGEINFRRLTYDKLSTNDRRDPVNGDASCYGAMANVYFDFRTRTRINPFFGAGIGVVFAHFGKATSNGAKLWSSDADAAVAYQGIGGFEVKITDHTSLDFIYRHYAVPRLHFETLSAQFRGPTLSLGLRHWF